MGPRKVTETGPRALGRMHAIPLSRRRLLGGAAAAAGGLAFGSTLLSACGFSGGPTAPSSPAPDDGAPATGTLRISNWPLYMADGFLAAFQKASGLTVDYKEDFSDNEAWFSKNKDPLSRQHDIGADLIVPTSFMSARLHDLGWLYDINHGRVPNFRNLRKELMDDPVDPGRKFSAPYMSGLVGLAYNRAATGREITKIDDLWDPAFEGKVSMLSDVRDGLGMIMLSQGNSVREPTMDAVQKAIDLVTEQKSRGQIRRFTGADYGDDLAAGNVVIAQAYSGDAVQLHADNPDLQFVVPDSGGTNFVDTMSIPYTSQNQAAAEAWMDYVYDRANYAKLVAFVQYVPVLSDMTDELNKIDPGLASNPLINPPQTILDRVQGWPTLTDEQSKQFNDSYSLATGS
jgi:spermidine/putrescine transport system substrate-binding protein